MPTKKNNQKGAAPGTPQMGGGNAPRERWAMVYSDEHYWLVGFDGGGRPIWSMNRLRAGFFAPSEIDIPNVQFIEA
jgi:hypothetical protein